MSLGYAKDVEQPEQIWREWSEGYADRAPPGDLMLSAPRDIALQWAVMLSRLRVVAGGDPANLIEKVDRQVSDLGMAYRLTGEFDERQWPLSPVPLLIGKSEWEGIEAGLIQRADLLEAVLRDIYGSQSLVASGDLPAALASGSRHFWRNMVGIRPPGGNFLSCIAMDLGRGPNGEWRVLSDRCRTPTGLGYALENRLALSRSISDLLRLLNAQRLAPFFADMRKGLQAGCKRSDPRVALLTPGRLNQSYAEQAHLARYLGFLLVEGDDLVVTDGKLFVRTIHDLKRIDGLWKWLDTSLLDPLNFDSTSSIGVPNLFETMTSGQLSIGNWPGCGMVESRAFTAFLPKLCRTLFGQALKLPNIATWWCGQEKERQHVLENLDNLVIGSAFDDAHPAMRGSAPVPGEELSADMRERLLRAIEMRPMDFVGQEVVHLSTTPAFHGNGLEPHPFTVRVYLARGQDGEWQVMPGGFARLGGHGDVRAALMGAGDFSADFCVIGDEPVERKSLLPTAVNVHIRRKPGILPSKAADNLFWLGRYLERGEATARLVRAALGSSIEVDSGQAFSRLTLDKAMTILAGWGALDTEKNDIVSLSIAELCQAAVSDQRQAGSLVRLFDNARSIGRNLRDRLAVDFWSLLRDTPFVMLSGSAEHVFDTCTAMVRHFAAISGFAAENMGQSHAWHFMDLGRRIERALNSCRIVSEFGAGLASIDDLMMLLDLCDCQISYRNRYLVGPVLPAVRDMVLFEEQNPRSLSYQLVSIANHLKELPSLEDDGMPELPEQLAGALQAMLAPLSGSSFDMDNLPEFESRLMLLSDAISQRYFLQHRKSVRPMGSGLLA